MESSPMDLSGLTHNFERMESLAAKNMEFLPCWDQLPEVLWEKVAAKLSTSCLATFRAVCKRWKELVILPLNPMLWKTLPEELVERVVSRVPFGSLATFRAVSNRWKTLLIPRAVAAAGRRVQFPGTSALLYFEPHKFERPATWWLHVRDSKGAWTGAQTDFQLCSIPVPTIGEAVRLVGSDGGLLFFSIIDKETDLVKEYVACNPLTGQSKSLFVPYRLAPPIGTPFESSMVDVGVVSNAETGSYKLVVAGLDCPTFVYDSLSFKWKAAARMPLEECETLVPRSVSCNGNLYWCVQLTWRGGVLATFVVKYDLKSDGWSRFRVDDAFRCDEGAFMRHGVGYSRIAWHKGKVLLSHLHQPVYHIPAPEEEAIDRSVSCQVWRWESNVRQLGPEMGLMSWTMIAQVEKFLMKPVELVQSCYDYLTFGQRNLFYTVMLSHMLHEDGKVEEFMRVLVHKSDDNSYAELPVMQRERRTERACFSPSCHDQVLRTSFLWAFFPSLISTP